MGKQDQLVTVIAEALPGPEHQKRRMVSEGVADEIAAAVRSVMGSEIGPLVLYHETGGHEGDGSDESVKRARATIGEDIGGGRG